MSNGFVLLDLVSQAPAVQRLLRGRSADAKLSWLRDHGELTLMPSSFPGQRQVYTFESAAGLECAFFLDGDVIVFIGDHTTWTVEES